ncbi:hypothetical protein BXO88_04155 [Oribacterium sp. C9]|uniref:hypothetical protein n=1 Tax=Oribacterium sp. C9 TaxID=1943579 RepID=UPI00098F694E|nr:hypothetical protein [Oribacterium sp. C9]OON87470.1 hypothetical protein BXO88_04155 [Oribacterium sp. C9]
MKISALGSYKKIRNQSVSSKIVDSCLLCENEKIIASHTIPQFVLKCISNHAYKSSYQFELSGFEPNYINIDKAGVFYMLCKECDNKAFETYENPKNYSNPTNLNQILKEIAFKNALKKQYDIWVALNMLSEFDKSQSSIRDAIEHYTALFYANADEIQSIYDMLEDDEKNFHLIYRKKLDYTTPIAAQGEFPYKYNKDSGLKVSQNKISWINIAILPFEKQTEIFMFTNDVSLSKEKKAYFSTLTDTEKLKQINEMVFYELDDYFFDANYNKANLPQIHHPQNPTLKSLLCKTRIDVPNYLSEEYKSL